MNYFAFIKRECRLICGKTWIWFASICTLLGFLLWWISPDQILSNGFSLWMRAEIAILVLLGLLLLIFILVGLRMYKSEQVRVFKNGRGKSLYVQYGDIFDKDVLGPSHKGRKNIVVPVNRCFDTIVDNVLISESTLHGKFMKSLYQEKLYDASSLNVAIQDILSKRHKGGGEDLSDEEKGSGNRTRFPIGTIAELPDKRAASKDVYFLMGLSKFDNKLVASTSREEFMIATQRLVEFCYEFSQEYPVVIPVFGTGLSRVDNINKQDALNFLVNVFKLNKDKIVCDIHIVVYNGDKQDVSIYDL